MTIREIVDFLTGRKKLLEQINNFKEQKTFLRGELKELSEQMLKLQVKKNEAENKNKNPLFFFSDHFKNENQALQALSKQSKIKGQSTTQPYFSTIYELFSYIPEAYDIVMGVVNSILHKDFIIEKSKPSALKKNEKFLREFMDRSENHDIHSFLLQNHILFGCAYSELGDTKGKKNPAGTNFGIMYPILTPYSQILVDKELWIKGVTAPVGLRARGSNNQVIDYDWKKIYHFKRMGLVDTIYGESSFSYNQPFFQLIINAIKENTAKMELKIGTNLAFEYLEDVSTDTIFENAKMIEALNAGYLKRGKQLHVPPGAKIKELKDKLEGLDYLDLIKLGREIVRTKFNYPISSSGESTDAKFQHRIYIQNTVNPTKLGYTKSFNQRIVKEKLGITDHVVKLPEMKTGDSLEIASEGEIGTRNAGMSVNEWRERQDLPKILEEWANEYYIRTDRYVYKPSEENFNELIPNGNEPDSVPEENLEGNPDPNNN